MRAAATALAIAACYRPAKVGAHDDAPLADSPFDTSGTLDGTTTDATLVGWWRLDEGAGTTTADATGHGDYGTLGGAAKWTPGVSGFALAFDGTSTSLVTMQPGTVLNDLPTLTIAAWIYPTSLTAKGGTGSPRLVVKEPALTATQTGRWLVTLDGSMQGALSFTKGFSTSDMSAFSSQVITLNTWQHVAVTWDGSETASGVHLYRDGIDVTKLSVGVSGTGTALSDATYRVGLDNDPSGMRGFVGTIDEVRIYNRVLLPAEIQALP